MPLNSLTGPAAAARTLPAGALADGSVAPRGLGSAATSDAVLEALAAAGLGVTVGPGSATARHAPASIAVEAVRRFQAAAREQAAWRRFGLDEGEYVLVVLRRPAGDDDPERLARVATALTALAGRTRVILPLHPGARAQLAAGGQLERLIAAGVQLVTPLRYRDLLSLQTGAAAVLTNSSRAAEEASALGISQFTIHDEEVQRPVVPVEALAGRPRPAVPLSPRRVESVLGIDVDALDMEETVARCEELIAAGVYSQHVCINVAKLMSLRHDPELREIVEQCDIVSADGQPVVWASRLLGAPLPARVAGIDLMHELLALSARTGLRPYILGARGEILDEAIERLRISYPGLELAGWRDGYFTDEEAPDVCEEIRATGADILFVAMGSPKKEYFLGRYGPSLGVPLVMGVGGAIDVAAGLTRRAPAIWQRFGLEWLYRMLQEPRRLASRYVKTNLSFVRLVAREFVRTRLRRQPPTSLAASPSNSR